MFKSITVFLTLFLVVPLSLSAQYDFRVSVAPVFNMPIGTMGWSYAPSSGFIANYTLLPESRSRKRGIEKSTGFSLSYTQFKPKADTLYYIVDQGGAGGISLGTAVYSSFKIWDFRYNYDFEFHISDKFSILSGASIGFMYGNRTYAFKDIGTDDETSEKTMWATAGIKAGPQIYLTKKLALNPFFSYNFMIQSGNTNPNSLYYNPGTGSHFSYNSIGLSINYQY